MNCIDQWLSYSHQLFFFISAEQQESGGVTRSSNDQTSVPPKSSLSYGKQQAPAPPTSSLTSGTRVCTLQPSANHTAGFALSGNTSPPYTICQIEKNSPAEKAGLVLNDALLSINGKPVTETSYEETVKLVKEALQQKNVELVVREQSSSPVKDTTQTQAKMGSQSSVNDQTKFSMGSNDSNNLSSNPGSMGGGEAPSRRSANAVEEYQSK
jgi:membrane-associated protease RseP (regulator of RpoE activity)